MPAQAELFAPTADMYVLPTPEPAEPAQPLEPISPVPLKLVKPAPGEQHIIVHPERVDEVLGKLVTAHAANEFPYHLDTTRVPQDPRHMPEKLPLGDVEHAMFLWTVCYYMRGGIKSVDAFRRLASMYDREPGLFNADEARHAAPAHIAQLLKRHGLGFQDSISKLWVTNAQRMQDRWDGNPLNIYKEVETYDDAVARIANHKGKKRRHGQDYEGFIGFQEKMVSMITYYLTQQNMVEYFDFPLPVDLHVLRVTLANEMITFDGYDEGENLLSEELLFAMRQLYHNYAVANKVSTIDLCDSVWLLSESLCGMQPGNITLEPNGRKKRQGRSTLLIPGPIDFNNETQRRDYDRSCGNCPINDTCEWNIPSKPYYIGGVVYLRGRRAAFPKPGQLGFIDIKTDRLEVVTSELNTAL